MVITAVVIVTPPMPLGYSIYSDYGGRTYPLKKKLDNGNYIIFEGDKPRAIPKEIVEKEITE